MKYLNKIFFLVAVLFMLTGCGSFSILSRLPMGQSIDKSHKWDDGPWIILGRDPQTEIVVSWITEKKTATNIAYGTNPLNPENSYSEESMSRIHHATLTNLLPGTDYYYRIGPLHGNKDPFSFKTAGEPGSPYKICVLGDLQPKDRQTISTGGIMARAMLREQPDLVIQTGDVSSIGGNIKNWHYSLENISLYASSIPFQSAVGNHDYYLDNGRNYREVFPYDYPSDKGLYYSFDYHNSHFIMLDNFDAGGSVSEEQKEWAEKDIADARKRGMDWIFLVFHHTVFTTGTSGQDWELQSWIVPLADKYRIDGVFFGHDHHYEHWTCIYGNTGLLYSRDDQPSGLPVDYWCTGGGGANLEISYGLLTMKDKTYKREWYSIEKAGTVTIEYEKHPWNSLRYIDHTDKPEYGQLIDGKHYYHLPEEESYQSDNEVYGYKYGEETLHYMLIEIRNDSCIISARYPNGDLLEGPDNRFPQVWEFQKKTD